MKKLCSRQVSSDLNSTIAQKISPEQRVGRGYKVSKNVYLDEVVTLTIKVLIKC